MHTPAQLAALLCALLGCVMPATCQQAAGHAADLPPTIAAPSGDADWFKTPDPPRHRALVQYTPGRLLISADNSSLNQILRQVARQTGMKTSGAVADQQVFGTYGPGDPGAILVHLLDGSGSNVLVLEDRAHRPQELILHPRSGGPTLPSSGTGAGSQDRSQDRPEEPQARPQTIEQFPAPGFEAAAQPGNSLPATAPTGNEDSSGDIPGAESNATTTQQSPNGVKTPQQIYDQLLRMQHRNVPPAPQ